LTGVFANLKKNVVKMTITQIIS